MPVLSAGVDVRCGGLVVVLGGHAACDTGSAGPPMYGMPAPPTPVWCMLSVRSYVTIITLQ